MTMESNRNYEYVTTAFVVRFYACFKPPERENENNSQKGRMGQTGYHELAENGRPTTDIVLSMPDVSEHSRVEGLVKSKG